MGNDKLVEAVARAVHAADLGTTPSNLDRWPIAYRTRLRNNASAALTALADALRRDDGAVEAIRQAWAWLNDGDYKTMRAALADYIAGCKRKETDIAAVVARVRQSLAEQNDHVWMHREDAEQLCNAAVGTSP